MDEAGCTEKCKAKNKVLELDLDRHKGIVKALVNFKWC
jgi:hypothetical protein